MKFKGKVISLPHTHFEKNNAVCWIDEGMFRFGLFTSYENEDKTLAKIWIKSSNGRNSAIVSVFRLERIAVTYKEGYVYPLIKHWKKLYEGNYINKNKEVIFTIQRISTKKGFQETSITPYYRDWFVANIQFPAPTYTADQVRDLMHLAYAAGTQDNFYDFKMLVKKLNLDNEKRKLETEVTD